MPAPARGAKHAPNHFILALAASPVLTGCERIPIADILGQARERQEQSDKNELEEKRDAINELIGAAPCERVEECRYTGLGAKPCGGPWEYLVYSTTFTDSTELAGMVAEYNDLEQVMNLRYGYGSDCAETLVPVLGRVEGRCVDLGEESGGGFPSEPGADSLVVVDSFDELPGPDHYELNEGDMDGDIVILTVSYSGGCEDHDFSLWATPEYAESLPPQHGLVLTHDAHGDACEAWITQELRFDLSPLKGIHQPGQDHILVRITRPIDSAGMLIEYVL